MMPDVELQLPKRQDESKKEINIKTESSVRSSLLFGRYPRGVYLGIPSPLKMARESQRIWSGPMSEQGPPTVRKPSRAFRNKSTELNQRDSSPH